MNTPSDHINENNDWHDALLDRGLAEVFGNETPPDLSEKILAAASAQTTAPTATPADIPPQPNSKRTHWVVFATAACLLVAVGAVLYSNSGQRYRRANKDIAKAEPAQAANNTKQVDLAKKSRLSKDLSIEHDGLRQPQGPLESSLEPKGPVEDPMLAVTPHIIIQEDDDERLGVSVEDQTESPSSPTFSPSSNMGLKGLINDAYSTEGAGQELQPERLHGTGQRFRSDAAPGLDTNEEARESQLNGTYSSEVAHNAEGDSEPHFFKDASGTVAGTPIATPPNVSPNSQKWYNGSFRDKKYTDGNLSGRSKLAPAASTPSDATNKPNVRILSEGTTIDLSAPFRQDSFGPDTGAPMPELETLSDAPAQRVDRLASHELRRQDPEANDKFYYHELAPAPSRDQYTPIHENPFINAIGPEAVSTFSIDVDTASYANVREFLQQSRQLPPPDAVRIEELVNYFPYDYKQPTDDIPFAANMEVAECPWNSEHRLARIAIKGREIDASKRPQSNLVFLIDVSGSMDEPNKLPLLIEGMKLLTHELGENDKVAIVVYASSEGVALDSIRGDKQETILAALDNLRAGGSTAGGAGINRAYQVATDNFITGGTNRVILCTDGDFNVGISDTGALTKLAEEKAKTGVFLTVLGFGRGNLNDAMMESISGKGNGNYHYVDNLTEARKVLVEEMAGTLVTIAKDVKIQVEFNPAQVAGYRLIGYENRMLATEDFNDDKKDAGEIGAGHTVTALYEIVPAGKEVGASSVDPLKYQQQPLSELNEDRGGVNTVGDGFGVSKPLADLAKEPSDELLTLKLRYKLPEATMSTKLEFPITDQGGSFDDASKDFQFAAAVASFGMLLRHSQHQGETSYDAVAEIAQDALGEDPHNYRAEFLDLVRIAKQLTGN